MGVEAMQNDESTGGAAGQNSSSSSGAIPTASGSSVFFARVPPVVPVEEVAALFSKFGTVLDTNLFKRWKEARTSKGCGIVTFAEAESAAAAVAALNGCYKWPEGESPMVLEPMDPSKLRQQPGAGPTPPKPKQSATISKPRQQQQQQAAKKAGSASGRAPAAAAPAALRCALRHTLLVSGSEAASTTSLSSSNGCCFDHTVTSGWRGCNETAMLGGAVPVHLCTTDWSALQAAQGLAPDQSLALELAWTASSPASGAFAHPPAEQGLLLLSDVWADAAPADGGSCAGLSQAQVPALALPSLMLGADTAFLPQPSLSEPLLASPPGTPDEVLSGSLQLLPGLEWPTQQAAGVALDGGMLMPPIMIEVPDAAIAVVAGCMKTVQQLTHASLNLVASSSGSVALQISGAFESVQAALQLCSLAAA